MTTKQKLGSIASFFLSLISCTPKSSEVTSMTPHEAYGVLQNGFAVLVDVRESEEVKSGIATPAQWMPTSKIESQSVEWQEFVKKLSKDKQVIFYCAKGGRAGRVAALLAKEGFKTANMGGYADWAQAGLPVRKP